MAAQVALPMPQPPAYWANRNEPGGAGYGVQNPPYGSNQNPASIIRSLLGPPSEDRSTMHMRDVQVSFFLNLSELFFKFYRTRQMFCVTAHQQLCVPGHLSRIQSVHAERGARRAELRQELCSHGASCSSRGGWLVFCILFQLVAFSFVLILQIR